MHFQFVFPVFFMCCGMFVWGSVFVYARRYFRTRKFPSVPGRVLKAERVNAAGGGSGFTQSVKFEYEVDRVKYCSRQWTALRVTVGQSASAAQARVAELLAHPNLQVFYDPKEPQDCFVVHGPAWSIIAMAFIGLAVVAFSVDMWEQMAAHLR